MKDKNLIILLLLFVCVFSIRAEITLALYDEVKHSQRQYVDQSLLVPAARFMQGILDKYGKDFLLEGMIIPNREGKYPNMIIGMDSCVYYVFPTDGHPRYGKINIDDKKQNIKIMNEILMDVSTSNDTLFIPSDFMAINYFIRKLDIKDLPYKPSEEEYYKYFRCNYDIGAYDGQVYDSNSTPTSLPFELRGACPLDFIYFNCILNIINRNYNVKREMIGLQPIWFKDLDNFTDPQIIDEIYNVAVSVIKEISSMPIEPTVILPLKIKDINQVEGTAVCR